MANPRRRRSSDEPIALGDAIKAVAGRLTKVDLVGLAALRERFAEVVGSQIAAHAQPLRLTGEVLTIAVDQPAWATQLRLHSGKLLQPLSDAAASKISKIEVVVRTS